MRIVKLLQPFRRVIQRAVLKLGPKRIVHGIPLVDWILDDSEDPALEAVESALNLIWEVDPRRFRRMRQDVRYIVVTRTAGSAGEHWADIRSVLLDAHNANRQVREAIAMTIVHEATHARVRRWGVEISEDLSREEAVCVRAEIAFAKKIPGTDHLIRGAEAKLASRYWERSRVNDIAKFLDESRWPSWITSRMKDQAKAAE